MPGNETPEEPKPEREKNAAAVALGRLGGLKGGKARAEKLSPEKRKAIAKKAAERRWRKKALKPYQVFLDNPTNKDAIITIVPIYLPIGGKP